MYRCPSCAAPGLVKQTRTTGPRVHRRYHCSKCKERFSTVETLARKVEPKPS